MVAVEKEDVLKRHKAVQLYFQVALFFDKLTSASGFQNFITAVICIAGIMVGIQSDISTENPNWASCDETCAGTYCQNNPKDAECSFITQTGNESIWKNFNNATGSKLWDDKKMYECIKKHDVDMICPLECINKTGGIIVLDVFEVIITYVFLAEVVFKTVAKFDKPWRYFYHHGIDGWNTFDFIVVAGTFLPGGGSMLVILRLLRLLRVLKLLKAFPELQVIVSALISGMGSIGYIGVILVLVFYVFGILGMILFQENDPWHFGTLWDAMFSLFRAATLEDWTDIMYTQTEGCANYGAFVMCADVGQHNCSARIDDESDLEAFNELFCCCADKSSSSPFAGYVYWVIFTILGSMVLLTLFIGVITTSMEEAQSKQQEEKADEDAIIEATRSIGLTETTVNNLRTSFNIIDSDRDGLIDEDELKKSLKIVSVAWEDEFYSYMETDGSEDINYVQFMKLVSKIKAGPKDEALSSSDEENDNSKTTSSAYVSAKTGENPVKEGKAFEAPKNAEHYKVLQTDDGKSSGDIESG